MELTRQEYLDLPDDERPHLFPGREPSNSTYVGTKNQPGCRCNPCRAAHAAQVRKNRQVIQLEPESVVDQRLDPILGQGEAVPVAEAIPGAAEASARTQPVEAVYSDPVGTLSAEDVAARILKEAVRCVKPTGKLPEWMIMAEAIARDYGVSLDVAKTAIRINKPYIAVRPNLNGGMVALIKKPARI